MTISIPLDKTQLIDLAEMLKALDGIAAKYEANFEGALYAFGARFEVGACHQDNYTRHILKGTT